MCQFFVFEKWTVQWFLVKLGNYFVRRMVYNNKTPWIGPTFNFNITLLSDSPTKWQGYRGFYYAIQLFPAM